MWNQATVRGNQQSQWTMRMYQSVVCIVSTIMMMILSTTSSSSNVVTAFVITTTATTSKLLQQHAFLSPIKQQHATSSKHKYSEYPPALLSMSSNNNDDIESIPHRTGLSTQPKPILLQALSSSFNNNKNMAQSTTTAIAAMTILASTLLLPILPANAARSGGRMGGSFSSGRSSSMRIAPSRSYSGGSSSGYYNSYRPRTTIVAPTIISPISPFYNPFYNPIVPYYGGGVGAISYSRGPGLFDLLLIGGVGLFVFNAISNTLSSNNRLSQWDDENTNSNFFGTGVLASSTTTTTVLKCNIALEVSNRDDPNSILSVLDRIANSSMYRTDTRDGVIALTKQVAMELLRRKSSIYSAAGTVTNTNQYKDAQRIYNQWSVEQRSKFEIENVNKFGKFDLSIKNKTKVDPTNDDPSNNSKATMAIVTFVLSVNDTKEFNKINKSIQSRNDVINVLQTIAALSSSDNEILNGAEILWTPEDRTEIITKQDMIADYPELNIV